jgi:ER lumen protein retaining receptor
VLPQLLLLRQTTVPTVIDSYYLVFLGSYRGLYCLNWIYRAASKEDRHFDPISTVFGIIQTALYIDFAWVYYTRQRVKLRAGGIVDSDDLERGWLVNRFVGKHQDLSDEDAAESNAENGTTGRNRWGARGISVSADEDLDGAAEDARPLTDPAAFEDDLSDDEDTPPPASKSAHVQEEGTAAWSEAGRS